MRCNQPLPQGEKLKVGGESEEGAFFSFSRMCAAKYKAANGESRPEGYDFCCRDCETGKAVTGGALQKLPKNVEFVPLAAASGVKKSHGRRQAAKPAGLIYHENDRLPEIRGKRLKKLTPSILRTLWKNPPLTQKERGTCPNCLRPNLTLSCFGLCGRCRKAAEGKSGQDLLRALDEKYAEIRILEDPSTIKNGEKRELVSELSEAIGAGEDRRGGGISESHRRNGETQLSPAPEANIQDQAPDGAGQDPGSSGQNDVDGGQVEMSMDEVRAGAALAFEIAKVCDGLKAFLLEKNRAYGNSAADPVRIFSKVDAIEQLNVRIDGKLSRLARGNEYPGDDTELDLIGYLILKRAIKRRTACENC